MAPSLRPLTFSALKAARFKLSAAWKLGPDERPHLDGEMPHMPGLYLFVDSEQVAYVGVTSGTLHKRIRPYARRLKQAIAGRPVYRFIEQALLDGRDVDIYTLCAVEPRWGDWNGLPIDHLVGLEAALIATLRPPWNTIRSYDSAEGSEMIEPPGP